MKNMSSDALSSLPMEIKLLVRDGVYALYTVRDPSVSFVLVANQNRRYFLSRAGNLLEESGSGAAGLRFEDAVSFPDLSDDQVVKLNYG